MKLSALQQYNVIRTLYADDRIQAKLEYISRRFRNRQAYEDLRQEIEKVEKSLSYTAKYNLPHVDNNGVEYRFAFINVGEGYYLLYHIVNDTVIVDDCLHKRELRVIP